MSRFFFVARWINAVLLFAASVALFSQAVTAATYTWDGDGTSSNGVTDVSGTWSTTNANWFQNTSTADIAWLASPIVSTDTAAFGAASNSTGGTITISGSFAAGGILLNATDSGAFTLQGDGTTPTLTLGASGITVNSGAGAEVIGSTTVGSNFAIAISASQAWTNNSATNALTINSTISESTAAQTLTIAGAGNTVINGAITNGTGTLALTKSGAGTLTLNAADAYGGATTISAGTLVLGNASALGNGTTNSASISLAPNGTASLDFNGFTPTASPNMALTSSYTLTTVANLTNSGANAITYGGTISGAGNHFTVGGNAGNITLSNTVSGSSGFTLTKIGSDTLTLTGATDNGFGAMVVNAGTLILNKTSASGAHAAFTLTVNSGGTAQLSGSGGYEVYQSGSLIVNSGGTLDFNGIFQNNITTFNVAGVGAGSNGALINSASATPVTYGGAITATGNFSIGGAGNLTLSGIISSSTNNFGPSYTGSGTLTLSNNNTYLGPTSVSSGTLAISGSNSYTGGTTISGGTLIVSNSSGSATGSGGVALNGGTLASGSVGTISGTVTGAAAVNTISPGGTLAFGTLNVGGLTTGAGTVLQFDLANANATPVATLHGDLLNVTGTGSSTTLTSGTTLFFSNGTPTVTGYYPLIQYTGNAPASFPSSMIPATNRSVSYNLTSGPSTNGYVYLQVTNPGSNTVSPNWTPTVAGTYSWQTTGASGWSGGTAPGISGDTANFNAATTGAENVQLNGAPHVAAITFSPGTGGSYSISQNTSTDSLTLDNGAGTATLTNSVGSNAVSAPIFLLSPTTLLANTANGGNLTLTGGIGGTGNLVTQVNQTNASSYISITTGAVIPTGTITNSGTASTGNLASTGSTIAGSSVYIGAAINNNISGIIQNSATSDLILGGNNSTYTGGITINAGRLDISNYASGTCAALGSGANVVTLGTGSANATLNYGARLGGTNANSATVAGKITVGGTGTDVISVTDYSPTFNGLITLANNLTVAISNSGGSSLTFSGGVTGPGNITASVDYGNIGNLVSFTTAAVNNSGTITFNNASVNGGTAGTGTGTNLISGGVGVNVTGIFQNSNSNPLTISTASATVAALSVNTAGTTLTDNGTASITVSSSAAGNVVGGVGNLALVANSTGGITMSSTGAGAVSNTGSITNSGAGTGSVLISANIGSPVTSVNQSSIPSQLTLSGTNAYTGATNVAAGTLQFNGTSSLPTGSAVTVAAGATLSTADAVAATVTVGSLNLANSSVVKLDLNTATFDKLQITNAAVTTGIIGISINPTTATNGSGGTLLADTNGGLSGSGATKYFLANNTTYTGTLTATDTAVSIASYTGGLTALTTAYWYGGQVTGALGAMALTNGTVSNWSSAATYAASGVVPGSTANVIFSTTTGATQQSNVKLGASMSLNTVTFSDTTPVTIGADGSILTLLSTGAGTSSAISANQNATINVPMYVGVAETWTTATSTTLSVGGNISGSGSVTSAGTGTTVLSGTNSYTGATAVTGGTLTIAASSALPSASAVLIGATSPATATLSILNNGTGNNGTISVGNSITMSTGAANATGTINVGTNGSNSGNTVAFGALSTPTAQANQTVNFTGSNSYLVSFSSLSLPAGGGHTTVLVPTSTSVTILGNVTNPMSGFLSGNFDTLILDGTSAGNAINGAISDSATFTSVANGGYTQLTKSSSSTWTLSGTNTYHGPTAISGGTLAFAGPSALPSASVLSMSGGTLSFLNNAPMSVSNAITLSASATVTVNVSNNGSGTGNTISLGALNNGTASNGLNSTINFKAANGYLQSYTSLGLTGLAGGSTTLNPTTTSVTILGNVTNQETTTGTTHFDMLVLDGMSAGNGILGVIADSSVYSGVNAGDTRVTKSNSSTWTLAGANTFHGPVTIGAASGNVNAGVLIAANNTAFGAATVTLLANYTGGQTDFAQIQLTGNISLANSFTVSGTPNDPNQGVNGAAGVGLIESTSGNNAISGPITITSGGGATSFQVDGGSTLTLGNIALSNISSRNAVLMGAGSGTISGTVSDFNSSENLGIIMNGSGTWTLSGVNTYTGATTINSGTLAIGNGTTGSIASTSAVSVGASGTLVLNLAAGSTFANAISNGGTVRSNSTGATTLSSTITGSGSLAVTAGTLTLSGNNSFGGGATVTGGTLRVANASGSATGSGTVNLNGGTLGGFTGAGGSIGGQVVGSATLAHTIAPGAGLGSFGTLNLNGGLTTTGQTTLAFNLGTTSSSTGTNGYNLYQGDLLNVGSSGQAFSVGSGTKITFGTNPTTLGDYRLIGGTYTPGVNMLSNLTAGLPTAPSSVQYSLSTSVDNGYVDLVVSSSNASLLTLSPSHLQLRSMVGGSQTGTATLRETSGSYASAYATSDTGSAAAFTPTGIVSAGGMTSVGIGFSDYSTTGARSGSVTFSNTANAADGFNSANNTVTLDSGSAVVASRSVTAGMVSLSGVFHDGTDLSGNSYNATLSTTGDDNNFTRVTAQGSSTVFDGSAGTGSSQTRSFAGPRAVAASGTLGTLTVTTAESGGGLTGEGAYANINVPYVATATSGLATWTSTSGTSWSTNASWSDNGNSGIHVAPGLFAAYTNTDTATFNGTGTTTSVTLDGATPHLSGITFTGGGSLNYTISQGSGGTGRVTLSSTGPATIAAAAGSHTISAPVTVTGGLSTSGAGTVTLAGGGNNFTGPITVGDGTNAGTLRLNATSASTIDSGVSVTVAASATLELDGMVSALQDGTNHLIRPAITNSGTLVAGDTAAMIPTAQQVGGIDGTGSVVVNDTASLTADHINQTSLVIGAGSTFTLAPSDQFGNPMGSVGSGQLAVGSSLMLAGSLAPSSSFVGSSGSLFGAVSAISAPSVSLGSLNGTNISAVPEPGTIALLLLGGLAVLPLWRRRQWG